MFRQTKSMLAGLAASVALATSAFAGELVINTDTSDPAPKEAFQALIDGFKAENPDITVKWNLFDHEGYKTSIRNFLTADAPDLANWYAGNRMLPYVNAGLFEAVDDVWEENGLNVTHTTSGAFTTAKTSLKSSALLFQQHGTSSKPQGPPSTPMTSNQSQSAQNTFGPQAVSLTI